jgi:hypothetical protein
MQNDAVQAVVLPLLRYNAAAYHMPGNKLVAIAKPLGQHRCR